VKKVENARPTAVNLARGTRRAAAKLPGPQAVLAEACANPRRGDRRLGGDGGPRRRPGGGAVRRRPRLLTHCNTGGLAAVTVGTALGVVRELHSAARSRAWSRARPGRCCRARAHLVGAFPVGDRAPGRGRLGGPFLMARGEVDGVILGADRICANGDVINKIGTYSHASAPAAPACRSSWSPGVDRGSRHPERRGRRDRGRGSAEVTPWADAVNPARRDARDLSPRS